MRILLIGSSGMLGQAVHRHILQKKICCYAPSHLECDLTRYSQLEKWIISCEITHIVNCAAYTQVDEAEKKPDLAYQVNVKGVENLGKIAKKQGCKVIHFSTDYVFDGEKQEPYQEEDPPCPVNVYGKTKLEGEYRLQEQTDQFVIIRTSWLFGLNKEHFISKIKALFEKNKQARIVSDQIGRPTFAEDLAEVTLDLISFLGIFHFANKGVVSWYEYALFIHKQMNNPYCEQVIPVSSGEFISLVKRPKYSVLSTKKVEKTLQVIPKSWKKGAQLYLEGCFAYK